MSEHHTLLIACALPAELRIAKQIWGKRNAQYISTGMGNYNTIYTLTKYLSEHPQITQVIFTGICGWYGLNTKPKLIQVANVINAHTTKELILPISKKYAPLHSILSSESPLHDPASMQGYMFVDMESRGAALVADICKLQLTILRVPVDEIGSISCCTMKYDEALEIMRKGLQDVTL